MPKKINLKKNTDIKFNKKLQWETNVHIYGQSLAIGDAHFLIDKIKAGDAYTKYFYNIDGEREGEPEGFVNEVDKIKGKIVNCFTLNNGGGGWYPVFRSYSKILGYLQTDRGVAEYSTVDGYYIDHGGATTTPYFQRPKCFFEKEHITIINKLIKKSLENKPLFTLSFPSRKILFMETNDKVQFYSKKKIEVDYSKPTKIVYEQLNNIYHNEELGFINAYNPSTEFCFDYHLDLLATNKFEVYKVESLVKDIDWYAAYYAKFHTNQKNIYKKKTVSKEDQKSMDDWLSNQALGKEMKEILKLSKYDPSAPEIESFKLNVDQYGFLHGYYLKAV